MQYARPYYMSEAPEQNRQHIWQRGTAFWDEAPSLVVRKSQVLHLFGSFTHRTPKMTRRQLSFRKNESDAELHQRIYYIASFHNCFFCKDAAS
jgi:hypothetical protein